MNWSAVKNLLIVILLSANLFLIFNIVRQTFTRGYIPEEEAAGAVELLSDRGLLVEKDCIPLKKMKPDVYESLYSDEYYTEAAQTMSASPREMLLALPEGGFSITAENGDLAEFDTEFGFRYIRNDNSLGSAYTEITADSFLEYAEKGQPLGRAKMKKLTKLAETFLNSCVSADSLLTGEIVGGYYDQYSGLSYMLASQKIGENEVYSHYAVCVFRDEALVTAYGRWYFGDFAEDYSTEIIDQINILFNDLNELSARSAERLSAEPNVTDPSKIPGEPDENNINNGESTILPAVAAMRLCFVTYWNADKTALYFIPAWQIDHIDGPTVVYNATNGTTYASK